MFKLCNLIFLILFWGNVYTACIFAQQSVDSVPQVNSLQELRHDLDALIESPDMSNAIIGACVQSIETGEMFYRLNESKNLIPASTIKIVTTIAALDYFGPDFRFQTNMYLDGVINENGEYHGNVIIRGSGDPTMSEFFYAEPIKIIESFAKQLDSLGISTIKGNIIGDDTYFDNIYYGPGWSWDDFMYPFSSQINALSINDNSISLVITQGDSVNSLSKYSVIPKNNLARIYNYVMTSEPDKITDIITARDFKSNYIEIYGNIAYDSTKKRTHIQNIAIDNPTMFFLELFKTSLSKFRIRHNGALLPISMAQNPIFYTNLSPVYTHVSPPLSEILKVVNAESHNFCAEMLLKTLAKETQGEGSFDKGTDYLLKYLKSNSITSDNIRIVDGSGLSRFNLFTPRNFVTLLSNIYRSNYREQFVKTLAEPGEEGTLLRRMKRSRAENNVRAKTGSMNNISAICGYVTTRDKEVLAFSIMMQNFTAPMTTAQNLQDLILMRLSSFSRK
jgi:PBP4 family serine-type D-alanyl-D-alanine carboxypeptidase